MPRTGTEKPNMTPLTKAPSHFLARMWVDALIANGIPAGIQEQYMADSMGQTAKDIWIQNPEQEGDAQELLSSLQAISQHKWECNCGESIEGGFQQCWKCNAPMPT